MGKNIHNINRTAIQIINKINTFLNKIDLFQGINLEFNFKLGNNLILNKLLIFKNNQKFYFYLYIKYDFKIKIYIQYLQDLNIDFYEIELKRDEQFAKFFLRRFDYSISYYQVTIF